MIKQLFRTWTVFMIGGLFGAMAMWLMTPTIEEAQMKARQISDIGHRVIEEQKSSIERGAQEVKMVALGIDNPF